MIAHSCHVNKNGLGMLEYQLVAIWKQRFFGLGLGLYPVNGYTCCSIYTYVVEVVSELEE